MLANPKIISIRNKKLFAMSVKAFSRLTSIILPIVSFIFILASCQQSNQQEVERLQAENDSLRLQVETTSSNVELYFADLNQIEENLRQIKQKENLITRQASGDIELGRTQKDRINDDIRLISELMEKNRNLIANLNNRLRNANTRIAGFEEMVARLNSTIEEKEIEIELLRGQLATMNLRVDFLNAKVDTLERDSRDKARRIEEQTIEMNTGYYIIGTRKELSDIKVISREGGFLGIGRTSRIMADFDHSNFTRVDIRRDLKINIIGLRPELITNHPTDSYRIYHQNGETFLEVTNPAGFWTASRYLVIAVR